MQSIIEKYKKTGKLGHLLGQGNKWIFNKGEERQILKKIKIKPKLKAPKISNQYIASTKKEQLTKEAIQQQE